MAYTGDVQSFKQLIAEGTKNEDGTVTISVPTVTETIDDAFIDKHVFTRDGLKGCELTWHVFTKEKWMEVFIVLSRRPDIKMLHLEHGTMDRDVMKKLAENEHLTNIIIETMTTNEEVGELAVMPALTSLSLIRFYTDLPVSGEAIAAFAKSNLESFRIVDMNNIEFWGLQKLLEESKTLKSLSVDNCSLTEDEFKVLFSGYGISDLKISEFGDGKITANALESLENNTSLTSLSFVLTHLDADAVEAISKNTSITKLELRSCDIDDDGVIHLYTNNATITDLNLRGNRDVGDTSAEYLAYNENLVSLNIAETGITAAGLDNFLTNRTLKYFFMIEPLHMPKKKDKLHTMIDRINKVAANNLYRENEDE